MRGSSQYEAEAHHPGRMNHAPRGVSPADLEENVLVALFALFAHAETAADIVERARAANRVDSAVEDLTMTIVSKSGSQRVREIALKSRRDGDTSMTFMEVKSPSDVAGTKLLIVDHANAVDETVLYLPALKRTSMLSGNSRKGSFVGSDLTYEDLEIRDSVSGQHSLIEDTAEAWVIDTTTGPDSSYEKVRTTISKADLVIRKVEFFGDSGVVKVLEVLRTEKDGAITLPVETKVTDLGRGTHTKLVITSHQLNVGKDVLPDETFTKAYLER